jgi:hypothetical protein
MVKKAQLSYSSFRGSTAACGRPPAVFRVLRRPGRARTLVAMTCLLTSFAAIKTPSQALSNAASGRRSLPGRLRIPPDGGTEALKTSGDRDAAQAPSPQRYPVAETMPGRDACAAPASAVGFLRLAPRTRSCARGAEMAWVKNAADQARFSGLAKETDSAAEGAPSDDEGASPSTTSQHRKNPGGPHGAARAGPTCEK